MASIPSHNDETEMSARSNRQRNRPVFVRPPILRSPALLPSSHSLQEGEIEVSGQPDSVSDQSQSNPLPCSRHPSTDVRDPSSYRAEEQEEIYIHTRLRIPAEGRSGDIDIEVLFCRLTGNPAFPKDGLYRSVRVPGPSEEVQRGSSRRRRISCKHKENSGRCPGWFILRENPLSALTVLLAIFIVIPSDGSRLSTSFLSDSSRLDIGNTEQRPHNRVPKRIFDAVSETSEEEPQVCNYTSKKRALKGLRVKCRSLEKKIEELEVAKLALESKAGEALREVDALQSRLEYILCRSNQVDTTTMCGYAFCEDCIET